MRRTSVQILVWVYGPSFLALIAIFWGSVATRTPISNLTADPTAIAGVHPLTGVQSNLGVLLWCASAALCLFTSALLDASGRNAQSRFLLSSGLLSVLFLLDDLFLFHEFHAPLYLHIPQVYVMVLYLVLLLTYLLAFRSQILGSEWVQLALAVSFLGMSALIDQFGVWLWSLEPWEARYVEDAWKFLGTASWLGYFTHLSFQEVAHPKRPTESAATSLPANDGH